MARKLLLLLVIAFTLVFSGCITSYTPKESVVELASRGTQVFTAVSDDATARLVWYLDGRRVAYGQTRYTFNAEQNIGTTIITHQLIVREEGGRNALYYKYSGMPAPSVTWTIRVMPPSLPAPCYLDEDGDGYGDVAKMVQSNTPPANCLKDKTDCNDDDEAVHPGAAEVCGDAIDQDCSGADLTCPVDPNDVDNDGDGVTENQGDCNDASPTVHPGAAEVCGDAIDQDCNGADLICPPNPNDVDNDGDGVTENQGDCNDGNAAILPGANDICGDGIDQDCSGADTICPPGPLDTDNDGDGLTENQGDCNDANPAIFAGATDICGDQIDQDCSGADAVCPPGPSDTDDDGDSYTENEGDCNDGNASIFPGANDVCGDGVDQDCSGGDEICPPDPNNSDDDNDGFTENQGDCNDSNPAVRPGAAESCNNLDDNCNGQTDEGVRVSFYRDSDGDTYGSAAAAVQACVAPAGYVADHSDCDDAVATVHPNATEICNNIDEDCDGQTDEGVLLTFYQDGDRDTFGNAAMSTQACAAPNGYVTSSNDCDDTRAAVHPEATETCNGLDDNCNAQTDEGVLLTFYRDADNDAYGNAAATTQACTPPAGYVTSSNDCNDTVASIHPGASEICNTFDDNCNGSVDEGVLLTFYRDADNDTYGNAAATVQACAAPAGYATSSSDCNDTLAAVHPGASETCNEVDDNCNGMSDEPYLTFYQDADSDSHGLISATTRACAAPGGYVSSNDDCNDTLASVYPGANETCNGIDENCNGAVDEGVLITFYRDADNDTYGNATATTQACTVPAGYVATSSDCNDTVASIHPGASETCNTADDNCNGSVDEGVLVTFYQDADSDSYGNATATTQACTVPAGYVATSNDCNDTVASIHPGASETCNAADDNCNGSVDEGVLLTFYRDADRDTYGNAGITTQACAVPSGYTTNSTDCNDGLASVHPGAAEICNTLDEDCDGTVDEGVLLTFYADQDSDGHGNSASVRQACSAPANYVASADDCNDGNAAINPGAAETCNQADDNCNGSTDEGDVCVVAIPEAPLNVVATDITSGRTDIQVTWTASQGAAFYRVYRAVYAQNGNYIPVGDNITETSFVYTQDFAADVLDQVGPFPQGDDYLLNLEAYRQQIVPYLFNFKAPAFFRVEACNADGDCSDLSAADAGQAEFIHTAAYSEVAQMITPLWFHPILVTFGSLPSGANALSWCGIDFCGPAGGMYMGRLNGTMYSPQLDVYYENYTDGWMNHSAARFWVDGYLGGLQRGIATSQTIRISGNFDATFGAIQARLFSYFSIPLSSGTNDGYVTVTYKGAAYQFALPINAETAEIRLMEQLAPARNDADYTVSRNTTAYPVPFAEEPLTDCPLWSEDLAVQCNRIP
ncbi:MAG: putative metal-binding motif-containing protein [Desulfobacterales bacterium]|nr:putative metal-binding motif-containing protein [Desulfobacterales bacterium]